MPGTPRHTSRPGCVALRGSRLLAALVTITDGGLKAQQVGWEQHRAEVAQAFGDLSQPEQAQLLTISRTLTQAMRTRLAGRPSPHQTDCGPDTRPRSS